MLHPQAKERLKKELRKALPTLAIRHSQFVENFVSWLALHQAEEVLPKVGKLRALCEEWIDDTPVNTFVTGRIREELRSRAKYDGDSALRRLNTIEGFEDTDAFADQLVEEFADLPRDYTLTMQFSEALPPLPKDRTTVQLGKLARLTDSDLFFRETFPLAHENEEVRTRVLRGFVGLLALLGEDFDWAKDARYFQVQASGYIGPYGTGSQFDEANRALRRFVGLGLGLKLFTYEHQYKPTPGKRFWIIHAKHGECWRIHDRLDADPDDVAVLDD